MQSIFGREFRIPNISAADQFGPGGPGTSPDFLSDDFLRLTGTSTRNGVTRYVVSERFQISRGHTYSIQNLTVGDTPPVAPEFLRASIDQLTLTALGQTTQLHVTATFAEGTTNDVTPRTRWTTYRTSNPQIATIGPDGLVTAVGRGIAFVTAGNEGATAVAQVNVAPGSAFTIVRGSVIQSNGLPAATAAITIDGLGLATTTASDGTFEIADVPTAFGNFTVRATFATGNGLFSGMTLSLNPIPGGITDAGIIIVFFNPPVLNCPPSRAVSCNTIWDFDTPIVSGTCGPVPIITIDSTVTNPLCGVSFSATRTWRVRDTCGYSNTCSQSISVLDVFSPLINCLRDLSVPCLANVPPLPRTINEFFAAGGSFIDDCNNAIYISSSGPLVVGTCDGTITRIHRVIDDCGNQSSCVQVITVLDAIAPVITCAPTRTIEPGPSWTFDPPIVIGTCDPSPFIEVLSTLTNNLCGAAFSVTRTWRARDACDNSNTCSQTVIVTDATPSVSESFVYPDGALGGRSGGSGFSSPFAGGGVVLTGSLAYADANGAILTTFGSRITATASPFQPSLRYFLTNCVPPAFLDGSGRFGANGATFYFAFLARIETGTAGAGNSGGISLLDGTTEKIFFGVPLGRTNWGSDAVNVSGSIRTSSALADSQTRLLVARIDFAAGAETIRVYVDPTLAVEPPSPTIPAYTVNDFRFTGIQLASLGATFAFDEIRMGPSYASVIGSFSPGPSPFAPAAVGAGGHLALMPLSVAAGGVLELQLTGRAGRSYVIEGSTNLTTWTPLSTNVAAGTALRYKDAESKHLPYRFYRARPAR